MGTLYSNEICRRKNKLLQFAEMVIGEGFMLKSWSRRRVNLNKRDKSCMTSLDRVKFKMISSGMETLASISNTHDAELDFLINATLYVGFLELIQLCTTPVPENVSSTSIVNCNLFHFNIYTSDIYLKYLKFIN